MFTLWPLIKSWLKAPAQKHLSSLSLKENRLPGATATCCTWDHHPQFPSAVTDDGMWPSRISAIISVWVEEAKAPEIGKKNSCYSCGSVTLCSAVTTVLLHHALVLPSIYPGIHSSIISPALVSQGSAASKVHKNKGREQTPDWLQSNTGHAPFNLLFTTNGNLESL